MGINIMKLNADGYYVPSYSKVHKLFENEFTAEYGSFMDENFDFLKKYLYSYTSTSGGSQIFPKHQMVSIILLSYAHQLCKGSILWYPRPVNWC